MVQIPCFRRLGIALMSVYSHSSKATKAEVQEHMEDISDVANRRRLRYQLIIGGDFNAEVGTANQQSGRTIGPHGVGKRNSRGQTLIDTCEHEGWIFAHSWTPQNNKATWKHPHFKT